MSYAGDLTPTQAWEMLAADPTAVLIDVRTAAEWAWVGTPDLSETGRESAQIEWTSWPGGAPNADFIDQVRATAAADQPVLFLCRSGARSMAAASAVTAAGFTRAYNILGGFEGDKDAEGHRGVGGWKASGLAWKQS